MRGRVFALGGGKDFLWAVVMAVTSSGGVKEVVESERPVGWGAFR